MGLLTAVFPGHSCKAVEVIVHPLADHRLSDRDQSELVQGEVSSDNLCRRKVVLCCGVVMIRQHTLSDLR
jgi:hypothetical protein